MKRFFLLLFIFIAVPFSSIHAELRINEIAWQGYLGDANNEWIELYNDGGDFSLDGWLLEAEDGTPSINLSGLSVGSGDFLMLERTDDTSAPEVTADKTYTGAMSNEGEKLILKNSNGEVIDIADFLGGWEMESTSAGTMSFFSSGWAEGVATPGSPNEQMAGGNDEEENDDGEGNENENEEEETTTTVSMTASGEKKENLYKERKLTIMAPKHAFPGVPFSVESAIRDLDGDEIRKGLYAWNMGDGTVLYKGKNEEFSYVYQHPGEYVIALAYDRALFGRELEDFEPLIYGEHVVTVLDKTITIESFQSDGSIILKNNSSQTMNLEGWVITNNDVRFTIPSNTIVRGGKTITLAGKNTGLTHNPVYVFTPTGGLVDYSDGSKAQENTAVQSKRSVQETPLDQEEIEFIEEELLFNADDLPATPALASGGNQKTLLVVLFVALIVFVGVLIWFMVSSKKQTSRIDGYEIIEE